MLVDSAALRMHYSKEGVIGRKERAQEKRVGRQNIWKSGSDHEKKKSGGSEESSRLLIVFLFFPVF